MRNNRFPKAVIALSIFLIMLPVAIIMVWTVTARWPWPDLLPAELTGRTINEFIHGSADPLEIISSSVTLASITAILGTVIAIMTARATEIYHVVGAKAISFLALLPLLVPGTVFAMGIQVSLIRMGLNDSLAGVLIVHLVAALPYCILIMIDMTRAVGVSLEEEAAVLGARPCRGFFDGSLPQLLPGMISSASMAYIISYSQYFTTLLAGGGKVKTLALVLVPYIQSGDRALSATYSVVFVGSALVVFFILEAVLHRYMRGGN